MDNKVFHHSFEINSFLVTTQKKLGLYSLLNLLQDCAWTHAHQLGFGYEDSLKKKVYWVLTRQKVVMEEWPEWHEQVEIKTWTRPIQKSFAYRDFEIFLKGRKIGECTTSWVLLDSQSRRPTTIPFEDVQSLARADLALSLEAPKIGLREDLETLAEFQVRNSDLDVNNHVNNTKYAQWILDSIPYEWHYKFVLHAYEVNFLAETMSGDTISIQKPPQKNEPLNAEWIQFQGFRKSDGKFVFSARLQVSSV